MLGFGSAGLGARGARRGCYGELRFRVKSTPVNLTKLVNLTIMQLRGGGRAAAGGQGDEFDHTHAAAHHQGQHIPDTRSTGFLLRRKAWLSISACAAERVRAKRR